MIRQDAVFLGDGTLVNYDQMLVGNGVNLQNAGLRNHGNLSIGSSESSFGKARANRFTNSDEGVLTISVGKDAEGPGLRNDL